MTDHAAAAQKCIDAVDDDSTQSLALLAEAGVHALMDLAAAIREQTERFNEVMLNEGVRTVDL